MLAIMEFQPEDWGMKREQRRARVHVPQHRPAAPRHARRPAARACSWTARRSWTSCPTSASTTAAPRRWASGRSWHTYIPYTDRIDYLGGRAEQLPLRAGRGEAGRHRGARPGQGDPHHDGGALPHHQPPGVLRHLQRGPGPDVARCSGCSPTASAPSTSWRPSPAGACTRRGSASAAWPRTCPRAGTRMVRDFIGLHAQAAQGLRRARS